jgi:glyoxylase-like metal-dependent hydrolase (beta-lactamase superfamily II)
MTAALQLHTIVSAPFEENTYLVWREGSPDALVIDAGLDPESILSFLAEQELTPIAFLCTHGHADHIAGNDDLKRVYPDVPLMIGRGDAPMLTDPVLNLSGPFGFPLTSPPADRLLTDGEILTLGGFTIEVRDLPGHSPGHVVFLLRDGDRVIVFAGDTLMRGTTGRGDFPGGNLEQLLTGIRERLFTLPLDTLVYPGHGPATLVGHEKATNPVLLR